MTRIEDMNDPDAAHTALVDHIIAGRARPLAVETAELNQEAAKRLAAFFKNEDYKP